MFMTLREATYSFIQAFEEGLSFEIFYSAFRHNTTDFDLD
jgi:hypothetical protein